MTDEAPTPEVTETPVTSKDVQQSVLERIHKEVTASGNFTQLKVDTIKALTQTYMDLSYVARDRVSMSVDPKPVDPEPDRSAEFAGVEVGGVEDSIEDAEVVKPKKAKKNKKNKEAK